MRSVFYLILLLLNANVLRGQSEASKKGSQSLYYTDSIYSENLEEYRKHNVYLPKGFDKQKEYPIIYATDGEVNLTSSVIKATLDSLIQNEIIAPVIYIGSHANLNPVGNTVVDSESGMTMTMHYRNFEYVPSKDAEQFIPEIKGRFDNHMRYFTEELIPGLEAELGLKGLKQNRIFYGTSNGAGFGAHLLNRHPDLIGTYLCFSTLGAMVASHSLVANIKYPQLFLKYGDQEGPAFKQEAEGLYKKYRDSGAFCDLQVYSGGHNEKYWLKELAATLPRVLSIDPSRADGSVQMYSAPKF